MMVAKILKDKNRNEEMMNLSANHNLVGERINFRTLLPVGDESYLTQIQNMILRTRLRKMVHRMH